MGEMNTFSVIIPVYNAEPYLEETLDSLVKQTIGFKEHIQVILVNDGSPDDSARICRAFQERYPENTVYVEQENAGVSAARNKGLEYVTGEWVNFLDSDDKWEPASFAAAARFWEEHPGEADVLAARIRFFEAKDDYHPLDYKFKEGSRIVRVEDDAERYSIQSTAATAFIRAEAIGTLRFDTRLQFGEDSTFINKLILPKKAYALVKDAVYRYRRHEDDASAVNRQREQKSYYTESLIRYHLEIERYTKELFGTVIPHVQALIAYDIWGRMEYSRHREILTEPEVEEYYAHLKKVLSCVEERILLENPIHTSLYRKASMLKLMNGDDFFREMVFEEKENRLTYRGITAYNFNSDAGNPVICFDQALIRDDHLEIEGRIARWPLECTKQNGRFCLKFGKKTVEPELTRFRHRVMELDDGPLEYYRRFTASLPVGDMKKGQTRKLYPVIRYGDREAAIFIAMGKFMPSRAKLAVGYRYYGRYQLRPFPRTIEIMVPAHPAVRRLKNEISFYQLARKKNEKELMRIRTKYHFWNLKKSRKKELWLISDRMDNAGDNGEVFFKYVTEKKPKNVEPVFVIGKDAECVPRLKKLGKVIFFEDKDYPYYFMTADRIISSGASEFTMNLPALGEYQKYMRAFFRFKYYYLQHGVACADLSGWLNKVNKNMCMLFTSSPKEREGFLNGDYYYTPEQVRLTGMARFDALRNGDRKQILVMPTWRRSIKGSYDRATNSVYFDGFKETEYFKFYNSLINDERLLKVMRRRGFTGLFCLHPIHKEQYVDFQANDVFAVNKGYVDYNQVFEDSSLFLTDYSSVLFDFAYLRKSVIYTQFDKEEFFAGQIYDQGYFDYEKDGFGPVCYDYESTVKALIEAVERDCRNPEEYLERANRFFAFSDQNNCERILNAIMEGAE